MAVKKKEAGTRSRLLSAAGLNACVKEAVEVDIPGQGLQQVMVRAYTIRERDRIFLVDVGVDKAGRPEAKIRRTKGEQQVEAVVLCTLDDDGSRAFEDSDRDVLLNSPSTGWITKLSKRIFELSNEAEDLGKESKTTESSSSSPPSPSNPESPSQS